MNGDGEFDLKIPTSPLKIQKKVRSCTLNEEELKVRNFLRP